MSQESGNGDTGGYGTLQAACAPPVQLKKAGKKLLWVWIAGGAVLITLVLTLMLAVFPSGSGEDSSPNQPPLLYMDGGDVFLMAGAQSIRLDGASLWGGSLNGMTPSNTDVLYYLANVSNSSEEGDLMRITLGDKNAQPECILKDVFSARTSADGDKVLFMSEYEGGTGKLFIYPSGGKPALVGGSVLDLCYGFSANGNNAYYMVSDGGNGTLMLYSGGETEKVYTLDMFENIVSVYVDDSGRVLFFTDIYDENTKNNVIMLYLFEHGNMKLVSRSARGQIYSFNRADEFLYITLHNELVYYAQGEEKIITDQFSSFGFPGYNSRDPREERSKHFIFEEYDGSPVQTLYEINLPGEAVKIVDCDGRSGFDDSFRYIAYVWEGVLYLSQRSGGGWDRTRVCENEIRFDFDESGGYLYYISGEEEDSSSGALCRISTSTGEMEELLDDVREYILWNGSCYALDRAGGAYLVKNDIDTILLEKDVFSIYPAAGGGAYAVVYDGAPGLPDTISDIYFLSEAGSECVRRDVEPIWGYFVNEIRHPSDD